MRVTVNGEQREITSARVDALLSELEYEGTHFAIAAELRRAAEKPLGRDGVEEPATRSRSSRRGREGDVMTRHTTHSAVIARLDRATQYAAALIGLNSGFPAYWIPAFAGMTSLVRGMTNCGTGH